MKRSTQILDDVVDVFERVTPLFGVAAGVELARGQWVSFCVLFAALFSIHHQTLSTKRYLLKLHYAEYKRVTGREP